MLKDIERQVGTKAMNSIMSTYARKFRFQHPTTSDFQKVVEKVTKKSWQPYFEDYIYGGGAPDFSVDTITSKKNDSSDAQSYESLVKITNKGSHYVDVPIKFTLSDGSSVQRVWNGEGAETMFQLLTDKPLLSAEIDPEHSILLESKHLNNFRLAEIEPKALSRWTLSVTKLLETVLGTLVW